MTAQKEKLKVGRTTVELSNTAKALFPDDGITKGDLVAYYGSVAEAMLPLRCQPASLPLDRCLSVIPARSSRRSSVS